MLCVFSLLLKFNVIAVEETAIWKKSVAIKRKKLKHTGHITVKVFQFNLYSIHANRI